MSHRRGFTSTDLIASLALVMAALAVAFVLISARVGTRGGGGRLMQSNTQVRGIHQALVVHAQGNNGWFAGLDNHGNGDPTVEQRYQILLDGSYFTGDYAISPMETRPTWKPGSVVTSSNYSFAMLQLNPGASFDPGKPLVDGTPHARRKEWRDTINTEAPVITDRNTGTPAAPDSIHGSASGHWRGSVGYNDNHVVFETTHIIPKTVYSTVTHSSDHLFEASGGDDALMIFSVTDTP